MTAMNPMIAIEHMHERRRMGLDMRRNRQSRIVDQVHLQLVLGRRVVKVQSNARDIGDGLAGGRVVHLKAETASMRISFWKRTRNDSPSLAHASVLGIGRRILARCIAAHRPKRSLHCLEDERTETINSVFRAYRSDSITPLLRTRIDEKPDKNGRRLNGILMIKEMAHFFKRKHHRDSISR